MRFAVPVIALLLGAGCAANPETSAIDRLKPCTVDEGPTDAFCGSFTVYENRETKQGRQIALKIVILPALDAEAKPDPVFLLAGGPGQGAAKMAATVREILRPLQTDRDIVLVDQRGTGASNPLNCDPGDEDSLAVLDEPDEAGLARLKKCRDGYDADLTQYTTPVAMDDLDDVRAYLGYDKINIIGGSYGTRAGLVYLRQHGDRVRTAVLDGVAPTNMRLPLYFARDAQRALDKLLADCAADAGCDSKYPDLANRTRALFTRLEHAPPSVRLVHPRTGIASDVTFKASFAASVIHGALYSPLVSSLVPALIARAEADDFQGMLALSAMGEGAAENMAVGMQLSVLCSEDHPFLTAQEIDDVTAGTLFARHLIKWRIDACEAWPKAALREGYREPVVSDVPTLVLSGDLDPVTPPSWGEEAAKHLSRAKHVVVPNVGHGVMSTGCGQKMIKDFITAGSADALDTSCAARVARPPFFVSPSGPDPMAGRPGAQK